MNHFINIIIIVKNNNLQLGFIDTLLLTGTADRMAWNILDYIYSASDEIGDLLNMGFGRRTAMEHTIK